jgi:hypothetical protein
MGNFLLCLHLSPQISMPSFPCPIHTVNSAVVMCFALTLLSKFVIPNSFASRCSLCLERSCKPSAFLFTFQRARLKRKNWILRDVDGRSYSCGRVAWPAREAKTRDRITASREGQGSSRVQTVPVSVCNNSNWLQKS